MIVFAASGLYLAGSEVSHHFGSATLHVVTVGNGGVELLVDEKPVRMASHAGRHFSADVSRGRHTVRVTDKGTGTSATYTVDITTGLAELLLPVRDDQCFARFDMTHAAYSYASNYRTTPPPAPRARPTLEARYPNAREPIALPFKSIYGSDTYFEFEEMPQRRRGSDSVFLMRGVPCSLLETSPWVGLSRDPLAVFAPVMLAPVAPSAPGLSPEDLERMLNRMGIDPGATPSALHPAPRPLAR